MQASGRMGDATNVYFSYFRCALVVDITIHHLKFVSRQKCSHAMGVAVSKQASLAPISLASTIIGFLSFAFTVATFVRVFWANLMTIVNAPSEIEDFLSNLKQGLYEERSHLHTVRKRLRRKSRVRSRSKNGVKHGMDYSDREMADDDVSTKVLRDAIRHMIKRFESLERPFLPDRDQGMTYEKNGWTNEDPEDWYFSNYRECGLRERLAWLNRRKPVLNLAEGLMRLQTRRIAKEIGEMSLCVVQSRNVPACSAD
jgi:hypothetical protein